MLRRSKSLAGSPRVLLFDDRYDLAGLAFQEGSRPQAVICLFWAAPSTKKKLARECGGFCYDLSDIVRNDRIWEEEAYTLTRRIIQEGPRYGELGWRTYLAEPLYHEFSLQCLLLKIPQFIESLRKEWEFQTVFIEGALEEGPSSFLEQVSSHYPGLNYCPLSLSSPSGRARSERSSLFNRWAGRMQEARLTGDWRSFFVTASEGWDKTYRWRTRWGRLRGAPSITKGGITFFSSYANNSRTLASFADLMPCPVQWVLNNDSAAKGFTNGVPPSFWVWQFAGDKSFRPKSAEDEEVPVKGAGEVPWIKAWASRSDTWRSWRATEFPMLANLTACWESYLDRAEPRLVVVANQWGIEGWFTQLARRRGIPVLQIMHGLLGGYFHTQTPILSDAFVVPGEFWKNLWPADQRSKIWVYNPGGRRGSGEKSSTSRKPRLTFFSWPLSSIAFYNSNEIMDGLARIFHQLLAKNLCTVSIRPHPLENPYELINRWKSLSGSLPSGLQIGKDESLDQILSQTDVGLMFRSTVMLNCLSRNIPVIIPGWLDFGWNQALAEISNLYLAPDFAHLEEQIRAWLDRPPRGDKEAAELFLYPPRAGRREFVAYVQALMHGNKRPQAESAGSTFT